MSLFCGMTQGMCTHEPALDFKNLKPYISIIWLSNEKVGMLSFTLYFD